MLGLCGICFTSGISISITKGTVHCENCNGITRNNKKEKEKKEEKILKFEDLPQANLEHRSDYAIELVTSIYEKQFKQRIKEERAIKKD